MRRADSVFAVSVELEAKAPEVEGDAPLLWRADPTRSLAGWLTGRGGVVLVTSAADGPFPRAGLPIGSVVLRLDGEPVRSARALIRNLQARKAGSRVEVHYLAPEILGHQTRSIRDPTPPIPMTFRAPKWNCSPLGGA